MRITKIDEFYYTLQSFETLEPKQETNDFFTKLCHFATYSQEKFYKNKKTTYIRKKSGEAEVIMEKYYATQYINFHNYNLTTSFPYWNNYEKLIDLEWGNAILMDPQINNILFIGGGSLPLSAILLAQKYNCHCTIIDNDQEAIILSSKVIKKLQLENKIMIEYCDILDYKSNKTFDLTYSAALLFGYGNNEFIINHIANVISSKFYIFRSAEGMKQLLYEKLDTKLIEQYFIPHIEIHPKNEIINSILLYTGKQTNE